MKKFSKAMQSRQSAQQETSHRRRDDKDFYMTKNNKAAGCSNTQTAQQSIFKFNFTQIIARLKATCFRVAAWLSVVGGSLC